MNNRIVALVEDVKAFNSNMIKKNVIGFVLIKEVKVDVKMVELLLPTEAPLMSNIGILSDAVFMDDVFNRL